jgi:hypothetical protein
MADGAQGNEYQSKLAHLLADLSNNFHDFTVKIETGWRIDGKFDDVELNYREKNKDKNPTIVKFQSKHRDRQKKKSKGKAKKANTIKFHTFLYDDKFAFQQFFSTFFEKLMDSKRERFKNFVLVTNIPMEVPMKDSSIEFEEYHNQDFILNRLNGTKSYRIARSNENIEFLKRYLLTMEFVKCVFRKTQSESTSHFEETFSDVFESERDILLQKVHVENSAQKWEVIDKNMFKKCATYLRKTSSQFSDIPLHKSNEQSAEFWIVVDRKLNGTAKRNRIKKGKFWDNLGAISGAQSGQTTSQKLTELIGGFLDKFIITTKLTFKSIDAYFQKTRNISRKDYLFIFESVKKHFEEHGNIEKKSYGQLLLSSDSESHDKVVKKELSLEIQEILGEEKPKKDEKVFTGSSENQDPSKSNLMAPKLMQSDHQCNYKMELDLDSIIASFSRITFLEKMVADLQETVTVLTEKVSLLEENSRDRELILGGIPEKENGKVSTIDVVLYFLGMVGIPTVSKADIKAALRIPHGCNRDTRKSPDILVKFHSSTVRDSVKSAIFKLKNETPFLSLYNEDVDFYAVDLF